MCAGEEEGQKLWDSAPVTFGQLNHCALLTLLEYLLRRDTQSVSKLYAVLPGVFESNGTVWQGLFQ